MKRKTEAYTSTPIDRRSFLRLSGAAGLGVASSAIVPAAAEAVLFNRRNYKVSRTRLAMGTFVSMTLIHPSRDEAQEAMELAFQEMDRLSGIMSRFDSRTAVAQLNSDGFLNDLPPEIHEVVARSLDYHRLSRGSFDITVKPLVDLFKKSFSPGTHAPPTERELEGALSRVGAEHIELGRNFIRFRRPLMGITLDGIAKGYIVDKASRMLTRRGIENFLVNAGGDIRTRGTKGPRKPWMVAIQDPEKQGQYPDVIEMTAGAVATSGNYEVYYDREKMFHHIVDPQTGFSPGGSSSVSVLAKSAMDADAMSTSVFVMPPSDGIRFIDGLPDCECLVLRKSGPQLKSRGWRSAAT